jgi:hypothetical protein
MKLAVLESGEVVSPHEFSSIESERITQKEPRVFGLPHPRQQMATTAQVLRRDHGCLDYDHRDDDAGDRFQRRARGACAAKPELSHDAGRALFIKSLPRLASYRAPASRDLGTDQRGQRALRGCRRLPGRDLLHDASWRV